MLTSRFVRMVMQHRVTPIITWNVQTPPALLPVHTVSLAMRAIMASDPYVSPAHIQMGTWVRVTYLSLHVHVTGDYMHFVSKKKWYMKMVKIQ